MTVRSVGRNRAERLTAELPTLEQRFPLDPAVTWLQLETALAWEEAGEFKTAAPFLRTVLATPTGALPATAPLRLAAQLHAGIVARMTGDAAGGEAQLAASGIAADQCSLFDTHPIVKNQSIDSNGFPLEALRWRFEGYVREDFDISGDGRVVHPRTIVAYPPLVFGKDTERSVASFRYVPPSIGGAPVGCAGQTVGVAYRMAR